MYAIKTSKICDKILCEAVTGYEWHFQPYKDKDKETMFKKMQGI